MENRMSPEFINGSDATPNDPKDPKNHKKVENYRANRRAQITIGEQLVRRRSVLFGLTQAYPEIHAPLLEDLNDQELEEYARHMLEGELKGGS